MPLQRYLNGAAFGQEEIGTMVEAFDGLCKTLGLTDRDDPLVEIAAMSIINAAKYGPDTSEQIKQRALIELYSVKSPFAPNSQRSLSA